MRNTLFKTLLLVALSAISVKAWSQNAFAVRASQDGDNIVVTYYLDAPAKSVQLTVSTDGGKTFSAPLQKVSGDLEILSAGRHFITWNVLEEYGSLVGDEIVFKVIADQKRKSSASATSSHKSGKMNFLIEGNIAPLPQMSWGVTVGFVKKVGAYARYLRNFGYADVNPKYHMYFPDGPVGDFDPGNVDGYTDRLLASGKEVIRRYAYCGGMMFNIAGRVYPYLGAGYGVRDRYFEDLVGDYALVESCSTHGFTFDAGITLKLGPVALSAGALTTAFETTDVVLGIGFMF